MYIELIIVEYPRPRSWIKRLWNIYLELHRFIDVYRFKDWAISEA